MPATHRVLRRALPAAAATPTRPRASRPAIALAPTGEIALMWRGYYADGSYDTFIAAAPDESPLGAEIALTTSDVPALFARAIKAGASVVSEPATKPWGQTVAYLRDNAGHLVELCTPMP